MDDKELFKQLTEHYQASAPTRPPESLEARFLDRAAEHHHRQVIKRGGVAVLAVAAITAFALALPNLKNERSLRVEPAGLGDVITPTPGPVPASSTEAIVLPTALTPLRATSGSTEDCNAKAKAGVLRTEVAPTVTDLSLKKSGKSRPWVRQTRFISFEEASDDKRILVIRDIGDEAFRVPVGTLEGKTIATQYGRSRNGKSAYVRVSRLGGANPVERELGDTTLLDINLFTGAVQVRGQGFAFAEGPVAGTGAMTRFATQEEFEREGTWVVLDLIDGASTQTVALANGIACNEWEARPGNVTWLGKDRLAIQVRTLAVSTRPEEYQPNCCGAKIGTYRTRVVDLKQFPETLFDAPSSFAEQGPETETGYRELIAVQSDGLGNETWGYYDETDVDAREFRWNQLPARGQEATLVVPNSGAKRLYSLQIRIDAHHWLVGPAKGNVGTHVLDLFDPNAVPMPLAEEVPLQL